MLRATILTVALSLLQGCGREDGVEVALPDFAAKLPGQTAILMYSLEGDLPQGLIDSMTENLPSENATLQFSSLDSRVAYLDLPEAQTGWQSLADSANFRQALAIAPGDAQVLVYLDMQLIFGNLGHDWMAQIPAQFRDFIDVLYLDEFQFVIAGVNDQGDDQYRMNGSIQTGGSGAGVAGLFPTAAKGISLLGGASLDDNFQFELKIDPSKAQGIILDLNSRSSQDLIASMMNRMFSSILKIVEQALGHLSGRVSVRVDSAGDWGLAAEASDVDGLMDLLDRHMREEPGDSWVFPGEIFGDIRVHMSGNLLLAGPLSEQRSADLGGQNAAALLLRTSIADQSYEFKLMPGVERLDFELERK